MIVTLTLVTFFFVLVLAAVRLFLPTRILREALLLAAALIASLTLLFPLLAATDPNLRDLNKSAVLVACWMAGLGVAWFCFLLSLFPGGTWGMSEHEGSQGSPAGKES